MDPKDLREQLDKLHAEMSSAPAKDPAARQSLDALLPGSADASLPDRLEQVAVRFEAEHPTLAASARRLIDLLGEVGI
jgi:hypothetical protein